MIRSIIRSSAAAAIAAWALAATPAHAQDEDAQLWTTLTAEFDIGSDTKVAMQQVARFSDSAGGLSELQLQADVERKVQGGLSLGAGYSYVPRYERGSLTSREHRTRQQISHDLGKVAGGEIQGRARLEQRWRDDDEDMMLRLRGRLMWTKAIGPEELSVRLWHESFVQLNRTDWGGDARYSRLRNQASLRRKVGGIATGELGYLNQYSISESGPDELVHALTFALTFGF